MSKLRLIGIALSAVFAFAAVAATSASAVEWLVNNEALHAATNAETEGSITLIAYNGENKLSEPLTKIVCSGIFDGTIGPGAADEVTKVLNLAMEEIGKDQLINSSESTLTGNPVLCNVTFDAGGIEDCKEGTNAAEVWPANLPWKTEIVLEGTDVLDLFVGTGGEPGWEVECTALIGIKGSNLCEAMPGTVTTLMENFAGVPPSVLGFFNSLEDSELADCSFTGNLTGEVISETSGDTWGIGAELERLETSISNT